VEEEEDEILQEIRNTQETLRQQNIEVSTRLFKLYNKVTQLSPADKEAQRLKWVRDEQSADIAVEETYYKCQLYANQNKQPPGQLKERVKDVLGRRAALLGAN